MSANIFSLLSLKRAKFYYKSSLSLFGIQMKEEKWKISLHFASRFLEIGQKNSKERLSPLLDPQAGETPSLVCPKIGYFGYGPG